MSQSIIRQWVYKIKKKKKKNPTKNVRERERERDNIFVWENKICIKWERVTNLQQKDENKKTQNKGR